MEQDRIRRGLLKGRISNSPQEQSFLTPPFREALAEATIEDLRWALQWLINHLHTKLPTYKIKRLAAIATELQRRLE